MKNKKKTKGIIKVKLLSQGSMTKIKGGTATTKPATKSTTRDDIKD